MAPSTTPGGLVRIAALVLLACFPTLGGAADPAVDPWAGPWAGTLRATQVKVNAGATIEIDCSALSDCRGKLLNLYRLVIEERERAAERAAREAPRSGANGDRAAHDAAIEGGAASIRPRTVISMIAWLDVGFEGIEFGFDLDPVNGSRYRLSMPRIPEYQSILAQIFVDDFAVIGERSIETTFTVGDVTTTLTLTMNDAGSATTLAGRISAPMLGATGRMLFEGELFRRPIHDSEMLIKVRHRYKARKRAVRVELGTKRAKKSARK